MNMTLVLIVGQYQDYIRGQRTARMAVIAIVKVIVRPTVITNY